jgi:beta-glucanase (GH16 family)
MHCITVLCAWFILWNNVAHSEELSTPERPAPPNDLEWKLVWNDEFDGDELDDSKWEVPEHRRRDGFWTPETVSLDGEGRLVMSTLKRDGRYLDACVRTRGKFEHAQGFYTARVKFQSEPGHWSAFWLYAPCVGQVGEGGVNGAEIEIMETVTPCLKGARI